LADDSVHTADWQLSQLLVVHGSGSLLEETVQTHEAMGFA